MFFPFISLRPLVGEAGGYSDEQFRRPSVRLSVRPFVRPSVRVCVCSVCTTLLNLAAGDLFILFFGNSPTVYTGCKSDPSTDCDARWLKRRGFTIGYPGSIFHFSIIGRHGIKYQLLKELRKDVYNIIIIILFWRGRPSDNEWRWRRFELYECLQVVVVVVVVAEK